MVENFSWVENKKDNFKEYVLNLSDGEVEENPQFPDAKRKLFMITEGGTDEILKKYGPTFFVDVPHS